MAVEIVEIITRCDLERGMQEPFICRDESGNTYYLKGSNCTAHGLTAEWLASNLALEFGLPVPTPVLARVGTDLIELMPLQWQYDLKYEYYFASPAISHAQPPNYSETQLFDSQIKSDIAVFDYWVHNEDRQLSEMGGNVNLLIEPGTQCLHVIDFNLAFDPDFDVGRMQENHVFGDKLRSIANDFVHRQAYEERLERALQNVDWFIGQIPDEWIDLSSPAEGYTEEMKTILTRHRESDIWGPLL